MFGICGCEEIKSSKMFKFMLVFTLNSLSCNCFICLCLAESGSLFASTGDRGVTLLHVLHNWPWTISHVGRGYLHLSTTLCSRWRRICCRRECRLPGAPHDWQPSLFWSDGLVFPCRDSQIPLPDLCRTTTECRVTETVSFQYRSAFVTNLLTIVSQSS